MYISYFYDDRCLLQLTDGSPYYDLLYPLELKGVIQHFGYKIYLSFLFLIFLIKAFESSKWDPVSEHLWKES